MSLRNFFKNEYFRIVVFSGLNAWIVVFDVEH